MQEELGHATLGCLRTSLRLFVGTTTACSMQCTKLPSCRENSAGCDYFGVDPTRLPARFSLYGTFLAISPASSNTRVIWYSRSATLQAKASQPECGSRTYWDWCACKSSH